MCSTRMFIARRSTKQRTEMYVTVFHLVRQRRKTRHYNARLIPVALFRITVQILPTDASDLRNACTPGAVIAQYSNQSTGLTSETSRFDSQQGQEIFLFSKESRPSLRPTLPPAQRIPEVLSSKVKRPGREADHSPPSSAEVKNEWSCNPFPYTPSWHVLGQFNFVFMEEILGVCTNPCSCGTKG